MYFSIAMCCIYIAGLVHMPYFANFSGICFVKRAAMNRNLSGVENIHILAVQYILQILAVLVLLHQLINLQNLFLGDPTV